MAKNANQRASLVSGGLNACNEDSAISTDSNDTEAEKAHEVAAKMCPHVGRAVSLPGLKKTLKVAWCRIGVCGPCGKDKRGAIAPTSVQDAKGKKGPQAKKAVVAAPPPPPPAQPVDPSKPVTIWLCLRCGLQLCDSNSTANHCQAHLAVPRSDLHCVVVNCSTWKIWCHDCKDEVYVDAYKKLREAVDFVRRVGETKGGAGPATGGTTASATKSTAGAKENTTSVVAASALVPKSRGLVNLGNTCFFNSVMQSLAQSRPLTQLLERHCQKGSELSLPSVQISMPENSCEGPQVLDAISVQLAEAGQLTLALAAFLKEMNAVGKAGTVNPGHLFGQISKRSPQFRGFHQQDAHELLRQLAEGLRSEEVKRQKSAILKQFGLCEKTDPKTVDSATKRKLQALGRHSNYTIIDKIFGGQLVSTIVCEQCHNSSQIYEPFLDLSLPLVEEKPQRGKKVVAGVSRQTSHNEGAAESEDIEFKDTKANMKKERAKSKKDKKKARRTKKKGVAGSADLDEVAEEEKKDNNVDENNAVTKQDAEEDNKDDGEEVKMQKELEENEKGEKRESPDSKSDEKEKSPEENEKNGSAESKYETADSNAAVAAADGAGDLTDEGIEEGPVVAAVGDDTGLATLKSADVKGMSDMFEKKSKKESAPGKALADGNEEDDEDGYSEENEEDWEWDYGEQWEEGDGEEGEADANGKEETQPLLAEDQTEDKVEKPKLVSLNPLSPERLARGTSENTEEVQADEERSSSAASSSASETGASSNGDVEDNLDESNTAAGSCLSLLPAEQHEALRNLEPFHPDPEHLDPHMEQLCRKVRKMSVATSAVQDFDGDGDGSSSQKKEYVISNSDAGGAASATASENRVQRLQNDWVARSLTSIAPRYHSTAGECSVYSCLTQFTAPELLTGNNKWACDRCTKMQFEKKKKSDVRISSSEPEGPGSDDVVVAAKDKKKTGEKKPPTVYSNASKQLLIFCPPAVLTIHLKRFQQTFFNLRKINRHVEFPLELDLAHFCSSTSLSTSNVLPGVKSILYSLYAVVEHSGRLQGGHYTAYVKSVKKPETMPDFSKFYSSPASKSEEVHSLLAEIEKKCRENVSQKAAAGEQEEKQEEAPLPSKWYYVSDAHVMEASAEKVLKCQAYLLFYERTL